jgi:CelD/BcsL family acetyltransferase involved in cellulose biosynthesis
MEVATTPEAVQRLLPEVVHITDVAEAANPRQHMLSGPLGAFARRLLAHAARTAELRLFVGRVGDEPAAYALMLRDIRGGEGIAMWLNRYDPRFSEVAPGHLLMQRIVEYACVRHLDHIDLLIGDARYKRLWADESYRTLDVTAAPSSVELSLARRQASLLSRMRQQPAEHTNR